MPEDRILGMERGEGIPPSKTMDDVHCDPFVGVPASAGFPPAVVWFATVCLVAIFGIGAWTIADSKCGHVWPDPKQSLSIDLNHADDTSKLGPFGDCYSQ